MAALVSASPLLGSAPSQCRFTTQHKLPRQPANPNAAGQLAISKKYLAVSASVEKSVKDSVNVRVDGHPTERTSVEAASEGVSRRVILAAPAAAAVVLSLGIAATAAPQSAQAFGLAGPKEWLKAQKRKSMPFLLNPLSLSAERLEAAKAQFESAQPDLVSVQAGVRDASLDCLAPGFSPGVELCTFKLIFKNSASLLDSNDPARVEGEEALLDLIWAFRELHQLLEEAQGSDPPPREFIQDSFSNVERSLEGFEAAIRAIFDAPA